jgi:hypothetical protein
MEAISDHIVDVEVGLQRVRGRSHDGYCFMKRRLRECSRALPFGCCSMLTFLQLRTWHLEAAEICPQG